MIPTLPGMPSASCQPSAYGAKRQLHAGILKCGPSFNAAGAPPGLWGYGSGRRKARQQRWRAQHGDGMAAKAAAAAGAKGREKAAYRLDCIRNFRAAARPFDIFAIIIVLGPASPYD
eukprot:SAG22_NODE_537_length_9361_cov_53.700821_7_plen_117_part_00